MVFVSPTTTVCGSIVGAIGGSGGGAASSVVLQSIVDRGIGRLMIDGCIFLFLQFRGFSSFRGLRIFYQFPGVKFTSEESNQIIK